MFVYGRGIYVIFDNTMGRSEWGGSRLDSPWPCRAEVRAWYIDVGSIPAGGALMVWPRTCGSRVNSLVG